MILEILLFGTITLSSYLVLSEPIKTGTLKVKPLTSEENKTSNPQIKLILELLKSPKGWTSDSYLRNDAVGLKVYRACNPNYASYFIKDEKGRWIGVDNDQIEKADRKKIYNAVQKLVKMQMEETDNELTRALARRVLAVERGEELETVLERPQLERSATISLSHDLGSPPIGGSGVMCRATRKTKYARDYGSKDSCYHGWNDEEFEW